MKSKLPTTSIALTAGQQDELVAAGYDIVLRIKGGLMPDEIQKRAAASYCPWAGLAEARNWKPDQVHKVILSIEDQWQQLEDTVNTIKRLCEKHEVQPNHPYSLLVREPFLLPALRVLKLEYGPEPKPDNSAATQVRPPAPKPVLPEVSPVSDDNKTDAVVPETEFTPARIDHAVETWLKDARLEESRNVSDMRLYLSLLGCIIVAGYDVSRREQIATPGVVHTLALVTAQVNEAARKEIEKTKADSKQKREQERKAKKDKKEEERKCKGY